MYSQKYVSDVTPPFPYERQREYNCPMCTKSYKYISNLRRHMKYECNKEPSFVCKICSKAYTQNSNLKIHYLCVHGIRHTL